MLGRDRVRLPEALTLFGLLRQVYFSKGRILLIGYSDKVVFLSLVRLLIFPSSVIYLPAYHPAHTMRRPYFASLYEKLILPYFLRASCVLALSNWEQKHLRRLAPGSNVQFIRFPVEFKIPRQVASKRRKVTFIGRNDKNKALREFLKFAQELLRNDDSLRVQIVTNNLEGVSKNLLDNSRFDFSLNVPDNYLNQIYNETKVLIVPSLWESLSLVALEAALKGCKVVGNQNVRLLDDCIDLPSIFCCSFGDVERTINFLSTKPDPVEIATLQQRYSYADAAVVLKNLLL